MSATSPESRLLTAAAREVLRRLGLKQRGRSRTWIDDHGWWLGIVEFQPSRMGGSYLNVGVMWLWHDSDHLAFHVGGREDGHERFVNPAQFALDAHGLARRAAEATTVNRNRFTDLPSAAQYLTSQKLRPDYIRDNYHAGIAAGLIGDVSASRRHFAQVLAKDAIVPWMVQTQKSARMLDGLAEDCEALRDWATTTIVSCRQRLKLEPAAQTDQQHLPELIRPPESARLSENRAADV